MEACSGAVIDDLAEQYPALSADTDLVTLTVGGNDIGFGPVVTECLKPGWWGDCDDAIAEADEILVNDLPGQLDGVYAEIARRSPDATVVVAGYPRLFNGEDCHVATFFSDDEMAKLNAKADELNQTIKGRVDAAGFTYTDVAAPFVGHAVCDDPEWIHNVRVPAVGESFHPKLDGHSAYAQTIAPDLVGAEDSELYRTQHLPQWQVRTGAATSADTDRAAIVLPDLDSAEARAAAEAAGISDAEVEALKSAQAKGGQNLTAAEAAAVANAQ